MKIQIKHLATFLFATIVVVLSNSGLQAQSAEITFDPAEVTAEVGQPFFVDVVFDTDNTPISVFDLHMLFEQAYLEVISIEILQGDLFSYHQAPTYNNSVGKIDMAAFQIGKSIPGTFSVVKLELMPIAATELTEVEHNMTDFPKTLMAYGGENMLGETGKLKVTITDTALGVDDNNFEDVFGLEVWPNPTSDLVNISFNSKDAGQLEVDIFDESGKLVMQVYSGNVSGNIGEQFEVDLSDFASGSYTCRVLSGEKIQTTKLNVIR
jgi:hypothetical protein